MRLRTFESFWLLKNGLLYTYPSLKENIKTEILVVGGGISGALISDALLDEGFEVTLVDGRDIGQGSTSATTSMLQYEIDVKLVDLINLIGEEAAVKCYTAGIDAVQELEQLIKNKKIDCGFQKKKSLYIAHNKRAVKTLKKEFELRNKYHLGVEWLNEKDTFNKYGIVCHGAIQSSTAASIDAYKFTHELIKKNIKRGLKVYDQTELKIPQTKNHSTFIYTRDNYKIETEKIIFCSGFESLDMFKEKIAKLIYTYATVSEPLENINDNLDKVLIWDTNDPYLYMRTTDDKRFLIGGEDAKFSNSIKQQKIKEKKGKILISKLKKVIPEIDFTEDFSWGGTFASTKDGLPYIGYSPEYNNCLFCLGFGGNGITFSVQGRKIITDLLQNKNNELSQYYRFGR